MAKLKDTTVAGTLTASGQIYSQSSVKAGTWGTILSRDSLELYGSSSQPTPFIDFHYNGSTSDYTHRILAQDGKLTITTGTLATSGAIAATGNITTSGSLKVGDIPTTLKNLCSNGTGNSAPGYVLGFNTDYLSAGYTSVANLRNTMGAPLMVSDGSYYTLAAPGGGSIAYLRTPSSGLIPYTSGGASQVGTSGWPFNYVYTNRLISKNFLTGKTSISITADAVSTATVTFSTAMGAAPAIVATASSTVPNTVREVCIYDSATTGFKIYEYRTNATDNTVHWLAYYR